ncbi:MAG: inositol monophosphatase family protein, partial [Candidatus Xenobia bacterium]
MPDYQHLLEIATDAARVAGEILRQDFHRPGGARGAHAKAPADTEAEWAIRRRLMAATPDFTYYGEETGYEAGQDRSHIWLIDPNDGTDSYLKGRRGSAVSIGLLRDRVPVLGVVFGFAAPDDHGDLISWAEGCPLLRNGIDVERQWPSQLTAREVMLISVGAAHRAEPNGRAVAPGRFRTMPSVAYRMALAAAGDGAVAISLHSPGAYDYGGSHALLRGAGGELVDEDARPVSYTEQGMSRTRHCFGGAPALLREIVGKPWPQVLCSPNDARPRYPLCHAVPGEHVSDPGLLSRAQGALLGQVAGDSLGSLVEFQSAANISMIHPEGPRLLEDGGTFDTIAGQPTDDSELALLLARSIVEQKQYKREAAQAAYVWWLESGPFDCGLTTRQGLTGNPNAESQANGSLMRISPLAVFGHAMNRERLADLARQDASITHPHRVCQDAAAVYTVAIATAISRGMPPRELVDDVVAWAADHVGPEVQERLASARERPPENFMQSQGWVLTALQNAFYRLLHAPTLEDGVVATVREGGDTDTNAAIAGALLGAVYGRAAVPHQWREMVLSCRPVAGLPGVRRPRPASFWPV